MKGSQKHMFDLINSKKVIDVFNEKLSHIDVQISSEKDYYLPNEINLSESQLTVFLKSQYNEEISQKLRIWWLGDSNKGKLPTWDFISTCTINGARGLLLVEAKAHVSELSKSGKYVRKDASQESITNHSKITHAINESNLDIRETYPRINISVDRCYQLSNRIAFSWWLAQHGIPVVLVYLGFLKANDMENKYKVFTNTQEWNKYLDKHLKVVGADELKNKNVECGNSSFILTSISF